MIGRDLLVLVLVALAHFALLRSSGRTGPTFALPAKGWVEVAPIPQDAPVASVSRVGTEKIIPATDAPETPVSPAASVGTGISEITAADLRRWGNPPPVYPEDARQRGEEGRVVVEVRVDNAGSPVGVSLQQTSGHTLLDESVLTSAKEWRFPEPGVFRVRVEFALQ